MYMHMYSVHAHIQIHTHVQLFEFLMMHVNRAISKVLNYFIWSNESIFNQNKSGSVDSRGLYVYVQVRVHLLVHVHISQWL